MTDVHAYCREVEAHLCRRNGGHLIRVVGPAFDVVKAWADDGVPLSVALSGIDRSVDRAARRGPRRRPIRIEFCDADVRDAFELWRTAVGAVAAAPSASAASRRQPLTHHLERVVALLTALRGSGRAPETLGPVLQATTEGVDRLRAASASARGGARDQIIAELVRLDAALVDAAFAGRPESDRVELRRQAEAELAPFRGRLAEQQWSDAVRAAMARLVRLKLGLPGVAFD